MTYQHINPSRLVTIKTQELICLPKTAPEAFVARRMVSSRSRPPEPPLEEEAVMEDTELISIHWYDCNLHHVLCVRANACMFELVRASARVGVRACMCMSRRAHARVCALHLIAKQCKLVTVQLNSRTFIQPDHRITWCTSPGLTIGRNRRLIFLHSNNRTFLIAYQCMNPT